MAKSAKKRPVKAAQKERAVLITTANRGVFFGYATDTSGDVIKVRACRNCIQWRALKGFIDLAHSGPNERCRIGPPADGELRNITAVFDVSPEAVLKWEAAPWS